MPKQLLLFAKAIKPNPGGIESYSANVAQAWAQIGFQVTVISQFKGKKGFSQKGSVNIINVGPGNQIGVFFRMLWSAFLIRKKIQPTLIHATTWRVSIPAILVYYKTPLTISVHGREVTQIKRVLSFLMRFVFTFAERVAVVSNTTLSQCLPKIPKLDKKAVVSWNGPSYLDDNQPIEKIKNKTTDKICHFYTLCRLVPRKNIAGVLQALFLLQSKGIYNWDYKIAGDGEERSTLESLSKKLGLTDKVFFLGRIHDTMIVPLYRSSDVFLHPQTSGPDGKDIEGFGLVIVDAMTFCLPVIAGCDGAPSEYLKDKETGLLVDGNDIQQLSIIMEGLISNPDERQRIGEQGRIWVLDNLSWKDHVKRLWDAISI